MDGDNRLVASFGAQRDEGGGCLELSAVRQALERKHVPALVGGLGGCACHLDRFTRPPVGTHLNPHR